MTKAEAQALKSFKNLCTCGGYAWQMNGRHESQPHMAWCPQAAEYAEWYRAMHDDDRASKPEPSRARTFGGESC